MIQHIPLLRKISAWRYRRYRQQLLLAELGLSNPHGLVIFDVGANDGSSFTELLEVLPKSHIYAFEPTPELVRKLELRFKHYANYHVVPKAVGEVPGTMSFNIAGQSDWGCSSLLEFSEGLERTWPDRTDFKVTQQIQVEVIRLDGFVREHGVQRIDFLHIDTQGTDLAVLRSLGAEISRVRSGVIEVPQSREVMLYKNQHTREDALAFLEKNGFEVWKTTSQQNEENLFFRRTG